MVAAVSVTLFTLFLLLLVAEVSRESLHVDKEVMPNHRPTDSSEGTDMTAGGLDGPPTALELRLAMKVAEQAERIYTEKWSSCMHDFPKSAGHYDPFPGLPVAYHECQDCGWVEGCAA
jgi:hypothetical protein